MNHIDLPLGASERERASDRRTSAAALEIAATFTRHGLTPAETKLVLAELLHGRLKRDHHRAEEEAARS